MRSCLTGIISIVFWLLAPLAAQSETEFRLSARFDPPVVEQGGAVLLVLTATVSSGYHAYGTAETMNLPVSLDVKDLKLSGLESVGEAMIPTGNPKPTPLGDLSYPLPEVFSVVVPLKSKEGSEKWSVSGEMHYQICNETGCLRPTHRGFTLVGTAGGVGESSLSAADEERVAQESDISLSEIRFGLKEEALPGALENGELVFRRNGLKATQADIDQLSGSVSATQQPIRVPGLGLAPGLMFEDEKVTIRASFEPAVARAGEITTLVLDVDVIDGWHAYGTDETSNTPVNFDQLKQDVGDLEFEGEPDIPPGEATETPVGFTFPLPHHFQVKQELRIPEGTKPGAIEVAGVLDYQICDEASCDPPAEGEFDATLTVEAGDARYNLVGGNAPAVSETADDQSDGDQDGGSWWSLILLCIGGGLFALAMPCTYPMIPITFSFFTKQAEKRGGNVLPLTIVYGLGIIAMFVFVGVSLSYVIIDVVNHWVTNTIIGVAFFFFAFVLFGWINLTPPQWMNKLAYKAQGSASSGKSSGGGLFGALLGVFFMGATLVITSFTCTAPIVGTLIANVAKLGSIRVGVGMAIFGLTMAIPFMLLSLAPGRVKAMPKSGEWMETLKISLGFVELAAAFKFVSMVDFARGWQALPRELFLILWTVIFGLWAMFLFGILRKAGTVNEGVSNGRMAGGMLVSLLAAYFFFGAMGNRLDAIMTGFIPQYSNSLVSKSDGQKTSPTKHAIVKDDPDAAIELAQKEGKLLLYNFTGFN